MHIGLLQKWSASNLGEMLQMLRTGTRGVIYLYCFWRNLKSHLQPHFGFLFMLITYASLSIEGPVREHNEDCVAYWQPKDQD